MIFILLFSFPLIKLGNSRPTVIFFNSVPYITEVSVDAISNTIKCLTFEKMPKLPFRLDELIITSKGIRCQFKPNRLLWCQCDFKSLQSCCIVNSRAQCPKGIVNDSHDQEARSIPHQTPEVKIKTRTVHGTFHRKMAFTVSFPSNGYSVQLHHYLLQQTVV